MFSFIGLVTAIALMMFLGFGFGATVGERNWLGPWPLAIAGAIGALLALGAFGPGVDDASEPTPDPSS